jgi:hypothetical protein
MSRAQWGHGYWKGKNEASKSGLCGLWFHSLNGGKIKWQGQVVRDVPPDAYAVQLYSWIMGEQLEITVVKASDMDEWRFYETDSDMRYAFYRHRRYSSEDINHSEQLIKVLSNVK